MRSFVLFASLIVAIGFSTSLALTPVPIDVTSLTITKSGHNTDAIIVIEATGLPPPYTSPLSGYGEALWLGLESCLVCPTGTIFHLNYVSIAGNGNFVSGFYPNGSGGSSRVSFSATGSAPDIIMNPRLSRKKKPLVFSGQSIFKGRIELSDTRGVVGVDDDVDLVGTVVTEINNFMWSSPQLLGDQRAYSYKSITFTYSK